MQRLKGFSLIELVITLAVVAIMSSMVLTFSGAFLQDNRLATANNDLVGSINLARSTAVSRGETASICASSNGASCTNTPWEQGWIVFSDTGTAGVIDGTDQILKVSNKVGVNVTVNSPSFYLQFKPQGYVASTCVNCYDKTVNQRFDSAFAAIFNNLSPISLAQASESDDSSDDDGGSGSSNSSSTTSNTPTLSCIAPASTNSSSNGSSGSSNDDSGNDDSASYNVQKYTDFAFNFLDQISPISSAQASESDDSEDSASDDTGESGSSGGSSSNNTNTGAAATCDDGTGAGQQPLSKSDFLICDGSKSAERGSRISVSAVGRVSRSRAICN